ncbi:MAG: PBP1A family penicillin-binding protein [bacterium]|nr:PBP1A family penicillin-binding protein [bacterium]
MSRPPPLHQRSNRTPHRKQTPQVRWWLWIIIACGLFLFGAGIIVGVWYYYHHDLPSLAQLEKYEPKLASKVLANDGTILTQFFVERRDYVPLARMPKNIKNAVLAIEDHRFYSHWGVDLFGVMRAVVVNVATMSRKQGASTITQQLARNLYFGPEKWLTRKIKEQLTAIQIERTYAKDEILEMYLTQVYFGHGAHGVGAAARRFFSKDISALTLPECALLAGTIQTPGRNSPIKYPKRAKTRRDIVLKRMYDENMISFEEYRRALSTPLALSLSEPNDALGIAPYFTEMVRQELEERGDTLNVDYLKDGLVIHTTLDVRLQQWLEESVRDHFAMFDKEYHPQAYRRIGGERWMRTYHPKEYAIFGKTMESNIAMLDSLLPEKEKLQIAAAMIDPKTGAILAMVGGRNFARSKYNRAVQATRQPGSTFKPFVYATALQKGYEPDAKVSNAPIAISIAGQKTWRPQNYDGKSGGVYQLRDALKQSLNLCAIRVCKDMTGIQSVIDMAHTMGITSQIQHYLPIAIGANGIKLIEAVNAYGAWGQGGILPKTHFMTKVEDNSGALLYQRRLQRTEAIDEETAYLITDMLRDVINAGTGASARSKFHFTADAAGKTGTTNSFTDAWFVGYTPQVAFGVWTGFDDPARSLGSKKTGGVMALPVWANTLVKAYTARRFTDERFRAPASIDTVKRKRRSTASLTGREE